MIGSDKIFTASAISRLPSTLDTLLSAAAHSDGFPSTSSLRQMGIAVMALPSAPVKQTAKLTGRDWQAKSTVERSKSGRLLPSLIFRIIW
jgi:hypothetical protein